MCYCVIIPWKTICFELLLTHMREDTNNSIQHYFRQCIYSFNQLTEVCFVRLRLMDWILRIKHYPVMRYCKYRNVLLILQSNDLYRSGLGLQVSVRYVGLSSLFVVSCSQ